MSNAFQVVIFAFGEEILAFHEKKPLKKRFLYILNHRKQTKGSEEEWKRKYIHFYNKQQFLPLLC